MARSAKLSAVGLIQCQIVESQNIILKVRLGFQSANGLTVRLKIGGRDSNVRRRIRDGAGNSRIESDAAIRRKIRIAQTLKNAVH